ncbi:unnamed protein product [Caenorhabditis auriculariae]|uniref:Uncharacterized protein n=1 Tax=Caenorhabditis auriculariae TaxID=2777116 RepID=A0A8S1GZL8_9PELO|nr:unnamed protein product [Caenorhabditis auriculariae]
MRPYSVGKARFNLRRAQKETFELQIQWRMSRTGRERRRATRRLVAAETFERFCRLMLSSMLRVEATLAQAAAMIRAQYPEEAPSSEILTEGAFLFEWSYHSIEEMNPKSLWRRSGVRRISLKEFCLLASFFGRVALLVVSSCCAFMDAQILRRQQAVFRANLKVQQAGQEVGKLSKFASRAEERARVKRTFRGEFFPGEEVFENSLPREIEKRRTKAAVASALRASRFARVQLEKYQSRLEKALRDKGNEIVEEAEDDDVEGDASI